MGSKLAPSILDADFANLSNEVKIVEDAGADYLHLDVIDGIFAPAISFGTRIVESLRRKSNLLFDIHLMIQEPGKYISDFADAGADIISVHVEGNNHLHRLIFQIKNLNKKAGVVLNPATPVSTIQHLIHEVDMVLLMSVNPGFGGQSFIPEVVPKIMELNELIKKKDANVAIEVDGGINPTTAKLCADAGANIFVAGSYIYSNKNVESKLKAVHELRESLN